MIQIKEEKIAELMFDIWHKSNDLKNPVMVGEYIAEELTKVKNLAIHDVSKRLFTYQEMLDVFTNFADEIDTSRFYTSGDELREELEPYVKQQIKSVLNVC